MALDTAHPTPRRPRRRHWWLWLAVALLLFVAGVAFWFYASITEVRTGRRLWPWSAYALCGYSKPSTLPSQVRIGLYEEFPNPWRLEKLKQLDFPVTLAIAARSRDEFMQLRDSILKTYPQVREVYFWPQLSDAEGYYTGPWSSPEAIKRVIADSDDLPMLWDMEIPRGTTNLRDLSLSSWWANRSAMADMFAQHSQPVHIWRTYVSMGLDPAFLRLAAMHFDPLDYPQVSLHLDLYTTGAGQDPAELWRIVRCGVERYDSRFIPSFGVLNDNEGPANVFVPPETLARNLRIAREAGVGEIWLFGSNGLNAEYLQALHDNLPLEALPAQPAGSR